MVRSALVKLAALATLPALTLAGCSGDEAPEQQSPEQAPAQVRDDLGALFAGDHPGRRQTEAGRCFAAEVTERVSLERLRAAGVLDGDRVAADLPSLPEDVAADWAEAQFACTDFVEESTRAQVKVTKGRLDTPAYAACLRAAVTEDEMRAAVVDALSGDWSGVDLARLGRAQTDCAAEAAPQDR